MNKQALTNELVDTVSKRLAKRSKLVAKARDIHQALPKEAKKALRGAGDAVDAYTAARILKSAKGADINRGV